MNSTGNGIQDVPYAMNPYDMSLNIMIYPVTPGISKYDIVP